MPTKTCFASLQRSLPKMHCQATSKPSKKAMPSHKQAIPECNAKPLTWPQALMSLQSCDQGLCTDLDQLDRPLAPEAVARGPVCASPRSAAHCTGCAGSSGGTTAPPAGSAVNKSRVFGEAPLVAQVAQVVAVAPQILLQAA